jgi:uncharacterized membrane protein YccC
MYGYFKMWFGPAIGTWVFAVWVVGLLFLVFICLSEAPAEFRYMDL